MSSSRTRTRMTVPSEQLDVGVEEDLVDVGDEAAGAGDAHLHAVRRCRRSGRGWPAPSRGTPRRRGCRSGSRRSARPCRPASTATLALLTGSAPLLSHASPCAMAALSAAVSGASELYTTMTGVPLASGNEACCSASARLLSTVVGQALRGVVGGDALQLGAHRERPGDDDPDGDDDPRVLAARGPGDDVPHCRCPFPAMAGRCGR